MQAKVITVFFSKNSKNKSENSKIEKEKLYNCAYVSFVFLVLEEKYYIWCEFEKKCCQECKDKQGIPPSRILSDFHSGLAGEIQ